MSTFKFPSPRHYSDQDVYGGDFNGSFFFPSPEFPPASSQSSQPRALFSSHRSTTRNSPPYTFFPPSPNNCGPFGNSPSSQTANYYGGQQPPAPSFPVPQYQPDAMPPPSANESLSNYTLSHGQAHFSPIPVFSINSSLYGHSESFPDSSQQLPAYSSYPPLAPHLPDSRFAHPSGNNYPQPHHQWTPQLPYSNNTRAQLSPPLQRSTAHAYHQTNIVGSSSSMMNGSMSGPGSTQWPTMLAPNSNINTYSRGPGRKRGLCVGINYEGQDRVLRGAVNDAVAVRDFLIDHGGYNMSDIVLLHDRSYDQCMQPTKENIVAHMERLSTNAQPNDSLFFHFSGHGGLTKDLNRDERLKFDWRTMTFRGMDSLIYTVDGEEIIDDTMHDIMVKPLPKGCRLTALFDACHSGTALDLPFVYKVRGLKFPNIFSNLHPPKKSSADVVSWSSCKDGELCADTFVGNTPVGAMSNLAQGTAEPVIRAVAGICKVKVD